MLNNQERMDTSEITEEKFHIMSDSEATALFVDDFNEQILKYGSMNPSTLNELNLKLAECKFSQKK